MPRQRPFGWKERGWGPKTPEPFPRPERAFLAEGARTSGREGETETQGAAVPGGPQLALRHCF